MFNKMINLWMFNKDIQGYSRIFTEEKIMLAFHYRSTTCYSRHVFGSKAIQVSKVSLHLFNLNKRFCHELPPHSSDSPKHYWNADMKCDKAKTCVGVPEVFGHA